MARETLDEATFAECVAEGRHLNDAAADRLALGRKEVPTNSSGARKETSGCCVGASLVTRAAPRAYAA